MEHGNDVLREALLAQAAPRADRLEAYRKEVRAMIEKKERHLARERRITSWMWVYLVLLCTTFLVLAGFREGEDRLWLGIQPCFWLLFGVVFVLRYFLNRNRVELLKEVKGLEVRVAELADRIGKG